ELEIPETHTVKKGETLAKIAYRYHLWVEDLEEINQLRGKKLKPGQIIYLQPPLKAKQEEIEGDGKEKREEKKEVSDEVAKVVVKRNEFLAEEKDQQLLVRVAKAFLGLKYSRGGTNINGMDCSAFVQKVFRIFDIDLPRTTREQFLVGYTVAREALCIGDLVFFKRGQARRPGHVGIYIGNGQFIHTSLRKQRVEVNSFENRYFSTRFIGAKRIEEVKERLEAEEISRN
ncbi:MAG: peptidoglycan endopeptidase, partial [Deltaproteobacteria bacterium]|nr:peptidoglycan endopeptidase [Deltaproteobacteria bacterium]